MKNSISKSEYFALFIFLAAPLLFGMGQEIIATPTWHIDSYFMMRSFDFNLNGNHIAGMREILYPLFIRITWFFGLGLRNSQELCYGIALFSLWLQVINLTNSRVVAWASVLPLTCFCYQHLLFDRSTYDALQLILLPLSFSSSIQLYCSKANWRSVIWAGVVVGLHVLTRAEGFMFILPPGVSLLFVWCRSKGPGINISGLRIYLLKLMAILAILLLSLQMASFINWKCCGFWAPTIVKSSSFQRSLSLLMAIDPQESYKCSYSAVPKASLQKAYQVSPSFRKAKAFIDWNMNGRGKSKSNVNPDGSIDFALFYEVWFDAGAFAVGDKAGDMLAYFDKVADELQSGFDRGEIKKRVILSTFGAPDLSIFDKYFLSYLWNMALIDLDLRTPPLPQTEKAGGDKGISNLFDMVALRRTGLQFSSQCSLTGWVVNPAKGIPKAITLDREAIENGISLDVVKRPGVANLICGLPEGKGPDPLCGYEVSSFDVVAGNLLVTYGTDTVAFPLKDLMNLTPGREYKKQGIILHVDTYNKIIVPRVLPVTTFITKIAYFAARIVIISSFIFLIFILLFQRSRFLGSKDLTPVYLIFSLMVSIALPRLLLLAAYLTDEPRYMATGLLSVWIFGFFGVSFFIYNVIKIVMAKYLIEKGTKR